MTWSNVRRGSSPQYFALSRAVSIHSFWDLWSGLSYSFQGPCYKFTEPCYNFQVWGIDIALDDCLSCARDSVRRFSLDGFCPKIMNSSTQHKSKSQFRKCLPICQRRFKSALLKPNLSTGWQFLTVTTSCWLGFGMFRHPAWAVGSYSSCPLAAKTVGTKSTGGCYHQELSPCT